MNKFILSIGLFVTATVFGAIAKKPSGQMIDSNIYLGKAEANKLEANLAKNKFRHETFDLTFRCDRYKRNSAAKEDSLNCRALIARPNDHLDGGRRRN